jgi:diguanylate cyclase (GGDEF)-like protein
VDALDITTLRVCLGVVVLAALVLFYVVTYRATRAGYARLWCLALLCIVLGTLLLLLAGTPAQAYALPPSNALLVGGAVALYAGARAFDGSSTSRLVGLAPVAAGVAAAVDDPGHRTWAGDWAYLPLMATAILATAAHLWASSGPRAGLRRALSTAVFFEGCFYLARWACLLLLGPQDGFYEAVFGAVPTTLVNLAVLVGAVLGMSALSTEHQVRELRSQATRDGLTQLLNRAEFDRRAAVAIDRMRRGGMPGTLVIADLDHFKSVNDSFGHDVGDTVLRGFADACRAVVRSSDLVARVGGEEFVLLLPGSSPRDAERVVRALRARLVEVALPDRSRRVTASYGVVSTTEHRTLPDVVAAADAALYGAKRAGRDRLGVARAGAGDPLELVELA